MTYSDPPTYLLWIKRSPGILILRYCNRKMRRLVIRPGAIGDFIVSLPAIDVSGRRIARSLDRRAHGSPGAVCRPGARHRVDAGWTCSASPSRPPALIEALREFDSIVSWYGANRPEFRETVAALGLPFTFLAALPAEGAGLHATDFYLEQVRAIAECRSDGIPRIECAVEREDYAVIHPFSGSARKNWPLEKFRALAGEVGARDAGEMVRRGGRPAAARCGPHRRSLRTGLLAGRRRASTSGTIPASRTWPRRSARRCWRSSGRPTPRFGRRAGQHVRVGRWR